MSDIYFQIKFVLQQIKFEERNYVGKCVVLQEFELKITFN